MFVMMSPRLLLSALLCAAPAVDAVFEQAMYTSSFTEPWLAPDVSMGIQTTCDGYSFQQLPYTQSFDDGMICNYLDCMFDAADKIYASYDFCEERFEVPFLSTTEAWRHLLFGDWKVDPNQASCKAGSDPDGYWWFNGLGAPGVQDSRYGYWDGCISATIDYQAPDNVGPPMTVKAQAVGYGRWLYPETLQPGVNFHVCLLEAELRGLKQITVAYQDAPRDSGTWMTYAGLSTYVISKQRQDYVEGELFLPYLPEKPFRYESVGCILGCKYKCNSATWQHKTMRARFITWEFERLKTDIGVQFGGLDMHVLSGLPTELPTEDSQCVEDCTWTPGYDADYWVTQGYDCCQLSASWTSYVTNTMFKHRMGSRLGAESKYSFDTAFESLDCDMGRSLNLKLEYLSDYTFGVFAGCSLCKMQIEEHNLLVTDPDFKQDYGSKMQNSIRAWNAVRGKPQLGLSMVSNFHLQGYWDNYLSASGGMAYGFKDVAEFQLTGGQLSWGFWDYTESEEVAMVKYSDILYTDEGISDLSSNCPYFTAKPDSVPFLSKVRGAPDLLFSPPPSPSPPASPPDPNFGRAPGMLHTYPKMTKEDLTFMKSLHDTGLDPKTKLDAAIAKKYETEQADLVPDCDPTAFSCILKSLLSIFESIWEDIKVIVDDFIEDQMGGLLDEGAEIFNTDGTESVAPGSVWYKEGDKGNPIVFFSVATGLKPALGSALK
jgi:hypothetical protein